MSKQEDRSEIEARGLKIGNKIKQADGDSAATGSLPVYADSNGNFQAAGFPFAVQLYAGAQDTSFSSLDVKGASTDTVPGAMYQTLVRLANATFTTVGWMRVNVTDLAGNIVNGNYYMPFGLLN